MKEFVLRRGTPRPSGIDFAKALNPQQLEVVMAGDGPMLVIAGAGSGKTRTLTYRVARLVESGAAPASILLLTFTNKAAREMLARVERIVPDIEVHRLVGGTFHHVGNRILRRFPERAGLRPNYTILDREDSGDLVDDAAAPFHDRHTRFPRGDVLADLFSLAANTETPLDRAIETRRPDLAPLAEDIVKVFRIYKARKEAANVVDFDDLLSLWRRVLREDSEFLKSQQAAFRHILVDEYQDTNRLQSDIVELLAGPDGNLMAVGDDAQSIYSFRGAHFGNIIDFPRRFPQAKVFKLETNYRSTPQILALANSSIACNERQFRKVLQPAVGAGPKPEVVATEDDREQARYVVQRIRELREEGTDLREIAVLYRAHYHSLELQLGLQAAGIPYEVRSGVRFFEQAHIKDVTAYLKILANDKDELAWKRVLRLYPRIGPRLADRIWREIAPAASAVEAVRGEPVLAMVPRGAKQGLRDLGKLLDRLVSDAGRRHPSETIRAILDESYHEYVTMNFPNAPTRTEDIRRLADFAQRFDSVEALLSEFALSGAVQGDDAALKPDAEDDALVLSTIHQAKGLEWRAVFVIWLTEGRFPDPRSRSDEDDVEEERRLFYVAATRAKLELTLCHPRVAAERGLQVFTRPSRFLTELDPETFETVRLTYG
jgi:DNA helicase-2/ATP-dependent DNA helicase PcrA